MNYITFDNLNSKDNLDHPNEVVDIIGAMLDRLPDFEITKDALITMYNHVRDYKTNKVTVDELRSNLKPFFVTSQL